jgi:hypothetical protein
LNLFLACCPIVSFALFHPTFTTTSRGWCPYFFDMCYFCQCWIVVPCIKCSEQIQYDVYGHLVAIVVLLQHEIHISTLHEYRYIFPFCSLDEMKLWTKFLQVALVYIHAAAIGVSDYKKGIKWPCFGF